MTCWMLINPTKLSTGLLGPIIEEAPMQVLALPLQDPEELLISDVELLRVYLALIDCWLSGPSVAPHPVLGFHVTRCAEGAFQTFNLVQKLLTSSPNLVHSYPRSYQCPDKPCLSSSSAATHHWETCQSYPWHWCYVTPPRRIVVGAAYSSLI